MCVCVWVCVLGWVGCGLVTRWGGGKTVSKNRQGKKLKRQRKQKTAVASRTLDWKDARVVSVGNGAVPDPESLALQFE